MLVCYYCVLTCLHYICGFCILKKGSLVFSHYRLKKKKKKEEVTILDTEYSTEFNSLVSHQFYRCSCSKLSGLTKNFLLSCRKSLLLVMIPFLVAINLLARKVKFKP